MIFSREFSPEKHREDNEVVLGIPKKDPEGDPKNDPEGDPKEHSDLTQKDTQHTREVPPGGATATAPVTQAHIPDEETELFSPDYVDQLVASFWTKVDQKIEQAVSHYQASPQAGQQRNTRDDAHTQEAETEEENNGKKSNLFSSFCLESCPVNILLTLNNDVRELSHCHSLLNTNSRLFYQDFSFSLEIGNFEGKYHWKRG